MSLASLFGDDEHTATQDAYTRTMKARKWVILAAAAFYAVHARQFAPTEFTVGVGDMSVNLDAWSTLTGAGLIYIALQYALLNLQLTIRYEDLIWQRFGLRELERGLRMQDEIRDLLVQRDRASGRKGLMTGGDTAESSTLALIDRRLNDLQEQLEKIPKTPKPGPLYIGSEVVIDVLRLVTPWAGVAVAAGSAQYGLT